MCHVLVIADDWLIACHVASVAERAGGTSVSFAATQQDAVADARAQRPDIILSDVELSQGTGPRAVQAIIAEAGPIPAIFITGTPEACQPCDPPHVVLTKPFLEPILMQVFRERAP